MLASCCRAARLHGASGSMTRTGWGTHCWYGMQNNAKRMLCHKLAEWPLSTRHQARFMDAAGAQTVRQLLPSTQTEIVFVIDATGTGNVARFFNHHCGGGNLEPVIVRRAGSMIPHVAMFASENITAGDELTFAYGQSASAPASAGLLTNWRQCCCGTNDCMGYLPRSA